jgi:TonB family protein
VSAHDWASLERTSAGNRPPAARRLAAVAGSLAVHTLLFALFIWAGFHAAQVIEQPVDRSPIDVVYLQAAGPGGGGGGSPRPAAPATPQIPRPRPPDPVPVVEPAVLAQPPVPSLDVPVMTSMSDLLRANGQNGVNLAAFGGGGRGNGDGPGNGNGLRDGKDGGLGGGARRSGADCTQPTSVREVRPNYSSEAMRAKIQGNVVMDVVVRRDGTVGDVRVVTSLDRVFGLDEAAVKAAKAWLFHSAVCKGSPEDMIVTIELEFRLH